MGLHHATLKAAATRYGALHTEGKSADEVKAEIAKDEKGFTPEEVEEIYAKIIAEPEETPEPKSYIVKSQFRDKDNFEKLYEVGDDVSHFDKARLENAVNLGLVEVR